MGDQLGDKHKRTYADVRAACISLRLLCVSLMRCNWLLEQRGVEGDDLLDHPRLRPSTGALSPLD